MKPIKEETVSIHNILRALFFISLLSGVIWYGTFQARNLLNGPKITLAGDITTVQDSHLVAIEGSTENITKLTLNGKAISTDENGTFTHTLVLENGYTIMTLHAEDRYGRTVAVSKPFVYKPQLEVNE